MNKQEILMNAIKTYGLKNQMIKTVEELSELSQVLCKSIVRLDGSPDSLTNDLKSVDNIFEEIADVEIMLEQCKMMFSCHSDVENWKNNKLTRLEKRLSEV